jgi:hypothetical protein
MKTSVELLPVGVRLAGGVTEVSARQDRLAPHVDWTTTGIKDVPDVSKAS